MVRGAGSSNTYKPTDHEVLNPDCMPDSVRLSYLRNNDPMLSGLGPRVVILSAGDVTHLNLHGGSTV